MRRLIHLFGFYSFLAKVYVCRGSKIKSPTYIGFGTRINGAINVRGRGAFCIGKYSALGEDIKVITQNHDVASQIFSLKLQKKIFGKAGVLSADVIIGDNVWVGDNVIFLPGACVGSNSIIAAGAVVSGHFQGAVLIGGVPAKVIKNLEIDLEDRFWDLDVADMREYLSSRDITK